MQLALAEHTEAIQGKVSNIRFRNPDNGYTVAEIHTPSGFVTVVGSMPQVGTGVVVALKGEWTQHPKFGRQFSIQQAEVERPDTTEGIIAYLESGLIPGIGPISARSIVGLFGAQTLEVLDEDPGRVIEAGGIGERRAEQIAESWEEHKAVRRLVMLLGSHGVTTNMAMRIYAKYGRMSEEIVTQDPYRLVWEMDRVGFRTADEIARKLDVPRDDPQRIAAALRYVVKEWERQGGHCYINREELVEQAALLLVVPHDLVNVAVDETIEKGRLIEDIYGIYSRDIHAAELKVQERIVALIDAEADRVTVDEDEEALREAMDAAMGEITLTDTQRKAILSALRRRVSVITGGPGTGKTTIVKALLAVKPRAATVFLMAPTGRAAQRLTETTGHYASTIHRGCGYNPELGWMVNEDAPLEADIVIIDESSMIDITVAQHLLEAIPDGAHVVLVGDKDQLPSVGPGNVLRDIMASEAVAVTVLDAIHRQAEDSTIIEASYAVNHGQEPSFAATPSEGDTFFFYADDQDTARDIVIDLVTNRIPDRFGIPPDEIQVLGPMKKGAAGVTELNTQLQVRLNPRAGTRPEIKLGSRVWRVGDKVMQRKNNYEDNVYNGDLGTIALIQQDSDGNQLIYVDFSGQHVPYAPKDVGENLLHAWAMTIHKSQGSEFRAVVIPLMTSHYVMLQRNLLYTAITRAREIVVMVGQKRAVQIALNNSRVAQRNTALDTRIQKALGLDRMPELRV